MPTNGVGAAERVISAMNILKCIGASDLKIEQRILYTPLYSATALQRAKSDQNYGTDEVVRKNLYFLAEQVKNINNLLIQLVQRGLLNLTEREHVAKHEDEFVKGVELLSIIIKKDSSRYKILLDIFCETGNKGIVDILMNAVGPDDVVGVSATNTTSKMTPNRNAQPMSQENSHTLPVVAPKPWNCSHCTFLNTTAGNVCSMCNKTAVIRNSTPAVGVSNTLDKKRCPACTYCNPSSAPSCEMCETIFVTHISE